MAYGSVRHSKRKTLAQVHRFGPSRQSGSAMRHLKVDVKVHRFGDHYDAQACFAAKGVNHEMNPKAKGLRTDRQCGEYIEARTPTKAVFAALKSLATRKR